MVLLDANVEGDIVSLGPPSQGVEEENWLLVASLKELGMGVLEGGRREGEREGGGRGKRMD